MSELLSKAARLAALNKKPSKNDVHELVKQLIKQGIIDGNDAAMLYAYFSPPMRKITSAFQWVALAAAKKDIREYFKFVYCDGENIVACDGSRLHLAPNVDGLAAGYYDKHGIRLEIDHPFPDYKRVVPKGTTTTTAIISECEIHSLDNGMEVVNMPSGHRIQRKYLIDAMNIDAMGDKKTLHYSYDSADIKSAIKIESDGLVAVIMPCRM